MIPALDIGVDELVIDYFAGGGGTSEGLKQGIGREPDVACNHDPVAIAMHMANHPNTIHLTESVHDVPPKSIVYDAATGEWKRVALFWLSPDCTDFSKAKGGKPVRKKIRSLAWVAKRWAALPRPSKPRVIMLENVEEFQQAGPIIRDTDGNWRPCPKRRGRMFRNLVRLMRREGFDQIEWRELRADDYGAATKRRRLFMIFRSDGKPIRWPEPTHGDPNSEAVKSGRLLPRQTFADHADWSLPTYSIFLSREEARRYGVRRPLAPKSMARIRYGTRRYVVVDRPFIIPITHGSKTTSGLDRRVHSVDEGTRTLTAAKRGELALVVPSLVQVGYGERPGHDGKPGQAPRALDIKKPLGTIVGTGKHALVSAFLAQHNGGKRNKRISGHAANDSVSTISARGSQQQLTVAFLDHAYSSNTAAGAGDPAQPLKSLTAQGNHHFLAEARLEPAATSFPGRAHQVSAFLMEYYSEGGQWQGCDTALNTIPTKDRFALVTVHGVEYAIVDIAIRMLAARELYDVSSFPPNYVIQFKLDCPRTGKQRWITKEEQNRLVGNAVPPVFAKALSRAQFELPDQAPIAEAAE
jgi:DNA (cytosine-5)-methyltransferase 1